MYNTEIKSTYIEEKTQTTTIDKFFLPNLFSRTSQFEEKLNKDVCNFTTKEIDNMYRTLDYTSFDSLVVTNNALSLYTQWCLTQGLLIDSQNHFREFSRTRLSELINKMIKREQIVDRDKILDWCMQFPNPSDAFIILGLFEGIYGQQYSEFCELRKSDINYEEQKIKLYNRNEALVFSKELCRYGIDAANEDTYWAITNKMTRHVQFRPSDNVIKEYNNTKNDVSDFQRGRRVYAKLCRALDYVGVKDKISATNIVDSGIIYKIKTESRKLGITGKEYINKHINDIAKYYKAKRMVKSELIHKYGEYLD